jgi:hypothetical protein
LIHTLAGWHSLVGQRHFDAPRLVSDPAKVNARIKLEYLIGVLQPGSLLVELPGTLKVGHVVDALVVSACDD